MTTALTTVTPASAPTRPGFLSPRSLEEAMQFADILSKSSLVPTAYRGKAGDILVAVQMGAEVGLAPMQALQGIAVISGKPCLYGDAALAVCRAHHSCEYIKEWVEGETAHCECKRRGEPPVLRSFALADAKRAGLWGKSGPWTQYPRRMMQMRARGFALRDTWADALRGMQTREEVLDMPASVPNGDASVAATPKSGIASVMQRLSVPDAQDPPEADCGEAQEAIPATNENEKDAP